MNRRLLLITALILVSIGLIWRLAPTAPSAPIPPTPPEIQPTPTLSQPALTLHTIPHSQTIQFTLQVAPAADIVETFFWLDTPAGRTIRRIPHAGQPTLAHSLTLNLADLTLPAAPQALVRDYWWAVRTANGTVIRQTGSVDLALLEPAPPISPVTLPADWEWLSYDTTHIRFRYTPESAAARDIVKIAELAEASYAQASAVISPTILGTSQQQLTTTIYLVPRVFWQGGAAYGDGTMLIAYLDRNYTGVETWTYFVHELIHSLAGLQVRNPELSIGNLLGEGIAVYGTGGHYQREAIWERAAALERSGKLVELCPLRLSWWQEQHEIAYLEGASFVAYLIERFGLPAFLDHYLEQQPVIPDDVQAETFCAGFNQLIASPFGVSFGELEAGWRERLRSIEPGPVVEQQWANTLRYYDAMRQYEHVVDPTARLLPDDPTGWNRTLTLSMTTQVQQPAAILRETMLIAADQALSTGDQSAADGLLDELEASLKSPATPLDGPLGRQYQAIYSILQDYARSRRTGQSATNLLAPAAEPAALLPAAELPFYQDFDLALQQLTLDQQHATALVTISTRRIGEQGSSTQPYTINLTRSADSWTILSLEPATVSLPGPPGAASILGQ